MLSPVRRKKMRHRKCSCSVHLVPQHGLKGKLESSTPLIRVAAGRLELIEDRPRRLAENGE